MASRPFRNPLLAKLDDTSHYPVSSAWEALEFLQRYWHGPHNKFYKIAFHLCRDAMDGWIPTERARQGFKDALQSADLLISSPKPSTRKRHLTRPTCFRPRDGAIGSINAPDPLDDHITSGQFEDVLPYQPTIGRWPQSHQHH
jgi:hypothetical protein